MLFRSYPCIVLNRNFSDERGRFKALHELGHLLLTFDTSVEQEEIERLCNLFANEMLLPSEVFIQMIGVSRKDILIEEFAIIQKQYGISIDAMMYKARNLNIISEQRYKTYWIMKNKNPEMKAKAEKSLYEKHFSERFNRLVYRAIANEEISLSKGSVLLDKHLEEVHAELSFI